MKTDFQKISEMITGNHSWWRVLAEIMFWGLLTGLLIRFFLGLVIDEFELALYQTLIIATIYAAVFVILGRFTQFLMDRFFPFRHNYDLLYQVAFRTIYMVAAFLIATLITEQALAYDITILDWETGTGWIILAVSVVAALLGNGVYQLIYFYNRMIKAERSAMQSQISALRAQINPHFLFNSLNSVAGLIRVDPDKAERVTEDLAELFRYSLRSSENKMVMLEDELSAAQTYFSIEKARFGDRVELNTNIPDDANEIPLPPFIIQPLVENAVKHGASESTEPCRVDITAQRKNGNIEITVTDTGPGFDQPDEPQRYLGSGHGLRNVKERVESSFYKSGSVRIMENGIKVEFPVTHYHEKSNT